VRTRRHGRRDEITLENAPWAQDDGLRQPLEASEELPASGMGDLGHDGPVGRRVHAIAGKKPIRPVLSVRTRRRSFALCIDGGDAAEVALDDTVIVVGNGQRPMQLRRVHVRVFHEWMDALGPLVLQLRSACGLQPARLSTFEAGLLARGVVIPGPPDLGSTEIGPDMNLGELAYAVLRRQLAVLREKEPGTRLGEDPEELHDMRVATRRLRAALDLFAEVLPIRSRNFRGELGWLAGVLGAVRDLDVQLQAQEAMVEPGQEDLWVDLTALLLREREAARAALLAGLDSVRWERLVSGMAAMVRQGPLRRATATRLAALVAVCSRHPAVVKAARRAKRSGEAADFHRLRIRCKRLRYSLEFGAELYDDRTNRYTRQLAKLQNQLGLMQDAEVAANRLADLATGAANLPASTIFVMGGVAELHRQEMARLLDRLPAEVSRVRGREWLELTTTMDRGRDRALALVPPTRRTLRVLPDHPVPEQAGAATNATAAAAATPAPALVRPELARVAGGGESPA
jgi:triphosphatase